MFQVMPNLEVLDLDNNKIKSIEPTTFNNCKQLKRLGLYSNGIETIHPLTFATLINLEAIKFGMTTK